APGARRLGRVRPGRGPRRPPRGARRAHRAAGGPMTLLLDPPAWPAHGTVWSHLVSDTSLHELRSFARAQGVGDRAFDLDHYDVPAERYEAPVAAGAVPVSGGELSRRLAGSVLRVPGRERRRASRDALLGR